MVCVGDLPPSSLLQRYRAQGCHTDCYSVELKGVVELAQYIDAFYTTPIFKVERRLLGLLVGKRSTDAQAQQLAEGRIDVFSAWQLEARADGQILMCDFLGRTRSWLQLEPFQKDGVSCTRLYFGSALVPVKRARDGVEVTGYKVPLIGVFHHYYSKILIVSAAKKLQKNLRLVAAAQSTNDSSN